MSEEFARVSDRDLVDHATGSTRSLAKGRAIDELTRRALVDHGLLDAAIAAIGQERTVGFKQEIPLGWLGAVRILELDDTMAVSRLLQAMSGWSVDDEEDLLRLWAPRDKFAPAMKTLATRYGWSPRCVSGTNSRGDDR